MWCKSGQIYPTFRCIKWIIFYCFCISCFKHWTFSWLIHFIHFLWLEDFDPAGTGQHDGIHTGTKQQGNTTGNQTGGNNEKMRNVTFILGYMDYMLFYGLCGLFVVIIHNLLYIYMFFHNHFSNIQWFIFKTSIAERNFHLINRSPSFRKCSNWNLPKNSKQHLYYGNGDFGTNDSKEKCSCM